MKLITIILAAGKGTRMKSDLPKVLHPLLGKPMINYVIDTAKKIGSEQIAIVVGHEHEKVIEIVNQSYKNNNFDYCLQRPQLGTAHAVLQCKTAIINNNKNDNKKSSNDDKYVLILSGDVPLIDPSILTKMIDYHMKNEVAATVMTTIENDPKGYGRIVRDTTGMIEKIVEEKDIKNDDNVRAIKEVNCGIYLFKCVELFENLELVDNKNEQKEYYLPKVLEIFLNKGLKIQGFQNTEIGETHGVNTIEQLQQLEQYLLSKN